MKVKATNKYKELNVKDSQLDRIPEAGEEFEITEERYKVLTETNKYKAVFVKKIEEKEILDTESKKVTKKNTRKSK